MTRSLTVLMTTHNRKNLTLECLEALEAAAAGVVEMSIVLVDAGSSDGTVDAVNRLGLPIQIIEKNQTVYWNSGMRIAWLAASARRADFILWLNDDLILVNRAISGMLRDFDLHRGRHNDKLIVVGKVVCPDKTTIAYGGYKHDVGLSRLRWRRLRADENYCDTMNGNCVLFPFAATYDVGVNSSVFAHSLGDIDYGLRARAANYEILQSSCAVGEQLKNEGTAYSGKKFQLSLKSLEEVLFSPKGIPLHEWLYFCFKFGGIFWPANFFLRYIKAFSLRR